MAKTVKAVKVAQTSVEVGQQKPGDKAPKDNPAPPELAKNYTFWLEEDRGGVDKSRPVSAWISFQPGGMPDVKVSKGIINVRLYSASSATVRVLGTFVNDGIIGDKGRRSETITEAVTFSGTKEATLSKGYGLASGRIIATTNFFKKDGFAGTPPTQNEPGKFTAPEEVYGTLMVEYTPTYKLYQINYTIPDSVITKIGKITPDYPRGRRLEDFNLLPITVLATAEGGYGATISLTRRMKTPSPENDDTVCHGQWLEKSRKTNTRKVYAADNLDSGGNPIDPSEYIDVEDVTEVTYECSSNADLTRVEKFVVQG